MPNEGKELLSRRALTVWRIRIGAIYILSGFLTGGIFVFSHTAALAAGILFTVLLILFVFVFCPAAFNKTSCRFCERAIIVEKGFIFHRISEIPFSKVEYCVISQTPCEKLYRISTMTFLCAGSFETVRGISVINSEKINLRFQKGEKS